ncbi:uncharacterized protein TA21505 [Theileria annulata]|uniref:Uncharacterized protein n=1 Tax=Theileria annulata TaxID=5874 RepID=Q4UGK6_THEAN|nr:uncharacterized protein TA21505 [Theileria annulata]CAI73783.1 hypothetical protein TA21505 [Theileria annulata]|eukprot:XP_954460.1 hypothetical protein TA21505 [Theileria annulata]
MNLLNSYKLIYYIFILLFQVRSKYSKAINLLSSSQSDVQVLEVDLAKSVHCVDFEKKAILQCKPRHVLIVHAAQWSDASCSEKNQFEAKQLTDKKFHFFDRTETLKQLCDGLSYCFLKPSKTRNSEQSNTFLGDPLYYHTLESTTKSYSLTVSVSCLNRELTVRGRKVTDTIVNKDKNIQFGCNEDEQIHLSVTRVDGYTQDGPNRSLTFFNFGPELFSCNLKQKCTVTTEQLKKCEVEKGMAFGTGLLVYYCRKPLRFSFCDHVKVTGTNSSTVDKFVLYAEQDSQVKVKAPIFTVLSTESAVWSTYDKLTDNEVKKDRKELLKFLCDDRNYCAFTPKRSAAGPHESSFEEVHFGGILNETKPLVLLVTFFTKPLKHLKSLTEKGVKTVKVNLGEKLSLQCGAQEEGTLHVLSAVAGPRNQTDVDDQTDSVKFKDLTKVMYKICYRRRTCEWNMNPQRLHEVVDPSTVQRSALEVASALQMNAQLETTRETTQVNTPLHSALAEQEITVKYMCKKYTHDPSLVDMPGQTTAFLEMSKGETHSLVDKEQAETVQLTKSTKLFINLEVFGNFKVQVGDFFEIDVPEGSNNTVDAFFVNNKESKLTKNLARKSTRYVFYLGFAEDNALDFSLDASDGVNSEKMAGKVTAASPLQYPISLKDVVKAKGSIVGMRVYLVKHNVN